MRTSPESAMKKMSWTSLELILHSWFILNQWQLEPIWLRIVLTMTVLVMMMMLYGTGNYTI